MTALSKLLPSRMTVAEFIAWPGDGDGRRFELVDGAPRAMAPASVTHGTIQANIAALLHHHLAGSRCRVVIAPGIVPRVRAGFNFRIPDLAVTCVPEKASHHAMPDPIVVVEILSPSNEAETRENVWAYASIPSVKEILLVRSTEIAAELLCRQPDGSWPEQPEPIAGTGEIVLAGIGFASPLAAFYADTYLAPV